MEKRIAKLSFSEEQLLIIQGMFAREHARLSVLRIEARKNRLPSTYYRLEMEKVRRLQRKVAKALDRMLKAKLEMKKKELK